MSECSSCGILLFMGRAKIFKHSQVLERAMKVFWKNGYDNSSLKELLSEMEILNGSFYNTFGSKKNLFIEVVRYYNAQVTARRCALLIDAPSFKKGVRLFFEEIVNEHKNCSNPAGCLFVQSFNSEIAKDEEYKIFIKESTESFEKFFEEQIDKGIKNEELSDGINSSVVASILVTHIQGMMIQSQLNFSTSKLEEQVEKLLIALEL